jgi:hypothetical protein
LYGVRKCGEQVVVVRTYNGLIFRLVICLDIGQKKLTSLRFFRLGNHLQLKEF